jgi:nitrilase
MTLPTLRIATAHISPTPYNTPSSLSKILTAITHASTHNATLISFPESAIPNFPIHSALLPPSHPSTHTFFTLFAQNSIYADGPEILAVRSAAKQNGISVSLGFSEKARWSEGTLWNSNVIIDEKGEVRVLHRKVVPTFYEKLSWGNGDGEGLRCVEVGVRGVDGQGEVGKGGAQAGEGKKVKIGALICGENTNPLARFAMMSQGQHVHVSSWPAVWPTRMPMEEKEGATTGKKKGRNFDNILANRIRAGGYCFEAKCFGIMCAGYWSEQNTKDLINIIPEDEKELRKQVEYALKNLSQAASMVLDPTGTPVPAFVINEKGEKIEKEMLKDEEGVLFADIDLNECVEGKQFHDLVGGYQRLDIFELKVDRRRRDVVNFVDL